MNKYWIRPIPLCKLYRDGCMRTYLMNLGKVIPSVVYVWYIEGSEPKVLVDSGCRTESMPPPRDDIQSLEEGLNRIGLKPEDIDIVILTHLHTDHVQLASKFVRAKFIVQKAELEFALHPHPMLAMGGSYDKRFYEDLNLEVIDGDQEVIDGVRVILTPGHSPGGQSVEIETPMGTAIITGFCSTFDNFEPPPEAKAKGFEVVAPGKHCDVLQAYDSVLKVKQSGRIILPIHEPSFTGRGRLP